MALDQVEIIGERPTDAARLAVVLRQAQWDLDHVAFNLPNGTVSRTERETLADSLTALAELLRDAD